MISALNFWEIDSNHEDIILLVMGPYWKEDLDTVGCLIRDQVWDPVLAASLKQGNLGGDDV